jgi:DNA-directed RNA polymerase sigma subunit (sigma70/sigma32)
MRLETVGMSFQKARCELIRGHLQLAAAIAVTYSNQGLSLPKLLRQGIAGLLRAVDRFGRRPESRFTAYSACWIRQSIRAALTNQPHTLRKVLSSATGAWQLRSHNTIPHSRLVLVTANRANARHP